MWRIFDNNKSWRGWDRLKKEEMTQVRKNLEVIEAVHLTERKRIIAEHMVDSDEFDDEVLLELSGGAAIVFPTQIEIEKGRIFAQIQIEKNLNCTRDKNKRIKTNITSTG